MNTHDSPISSKESPESFPWWRLVGLGVFLGLLLVGIFGQKEKTAEKLPPFGGANLSQFPFITSGGPGEDILPDDTVPSEVAPSVMGHTWFVSPEGSDANLGDSQDIPLKRVQKAIDRAQAADSVFLMPGEYFEHIVSRRDGREKEPIVIRGTAESILHGDDESNRVIEINHDYITLDGFTVDGLVGAKDSPKSYRDKLIYAQGKGERQGVRGLKIQRMIIENAGGECIRLRYFAEKNEIAYNTIRHCGVYDFLFDEGGKNGEGVYIGTAPEQRGKDSPSDDPDVSRDNWIHHNFINTQGNECVDIKEDAIKNTVEYNRCTGQRDKESAGLDARGDENTFRFNEVFGNRGAGVRLGGDKKSQGINNAVYGNTIRENEEGGIKIMRRPQGKICGNTITKNKGSDFTGEYGKDFENPAACL